jgi:FkbM family methyltransferase
MREVLLKPFLRLAGRLASTDLYLYPAAARVLAHRRDRLKCIRTHTGEGFSMELKVSEYPDGSMYVGIYEPALMRLLSTLLRPGDVAIDAGANIGYITLHLSRLVGPAGRVHSFEPMPDNLLRLRDSIQANACANVTVHPQAVGEGAGKVDLYTFSDRYGSWHALGSLRPLKAHYRAIPCDMIRLDQSVEGPVRLIKMDVEGAEVDAVLGAAGIIRRHHPHIIVESNPRALTAFGHTFADLYRAVLGAHPGYEALDLEHMRPRRLSERAVLSGAAPVRQCNVWFRPI